MAWTLSGAAAAAARHAGPPRTRGAGPRWLATGVGSAGQSQVEGGRAGARCVGSVACVGRRWGRGGGGGAEAADSGEVAFDVGFVAGEERAHALAPVRHVSGGPHHLALLAVHELVAFRNGLASPRVEHLLAHLVAARQRRRRTAAHLRVDRQRVEQRPGRGQLCVCGVEAGVGTAEAARGRPGRPG